MSKTVKFTEEQLEILIGSDNYTRLCGKIKVHHMGGSSHFKPKGKSTWMEYWKDKWSEVQPYTVPCDSCNVGKPESEFVIGHIKDENGNEYLYPVCKECNDRYKNGQEADHYFFARKSIIKNFDRNDAETV